MDFIKKWTGIISGPLWYNIAIIFAIGIFLIAASFYWLFPVLNGVEQNVITSQNATTSHTVDLLDLFLDLTFQDLFHFGSHALESVNDYEKLSKIFFGSRHDFLNLLVFDTNGKLLTSLAARGVRAQPQLSGVSAQNNLFFQEALGGKRYISPVFFGPNGPSIQIATPITKNGKIIAVVSGEIDFTLLWGVASKTSVEEGKIYLVDNRGARISDPNIELARSGENLKYREIVNLLVQGRERIEFNRYVNEKNENVLALGLKMPSTGWGVVVEQREAVALKQRNQTLFVAVTFSVASLALLALLIFSTIRLMRAIVSVGRERAERERTIAYIPDGIIEYTGENQILAINPAAKKYLDIAESPPKELYITESAAAFLGFEKLWKVFFPTQKQNVGENVYEITFMSPQKRVLQIITVYIKGIGPLPEQRYLKIIHDVTHERQ